MQGHMNFLSSRIKLSLNYRFELSKSKRIRGAIPTIARDIS